MYKKGQKWVFAAITVFSLALGVATITSAVSADTIPDVQAGKNNLHSSSPNAVLDTTQQKVVSAKNQGQTATTVVNEQQAKIAEKDSGQQKQQKEDSDQANTTVVNEQQSNLDNDKGNGQSNQHGDLVENKNGAKTTSKKQPNLVAPNDDRSASRPVNEQQTKTTDQNDDQTSTNNSSDRQTDDQKNSRSANNQQSDPEDQNNGQQSAQQDNFTKDTQKDGLADAPKNSDQNETDKNQGSAADNLDEIIANSKNIKMINAKNYYVDDNGQIKKNFAIELDGHILYFAKDTGELTNTSKLYKEGLSSLDDAYTGNNAAYNTTNKSFKTTDGYLTANSWYRPKKILQDGVYWKKSSATDYRPLLMNWWPDKRTQVNYLNFMQQQNLGDGKNYTVDDAQINLNNSAQRVQANIEKKISQTGNTEWLQDLITNFVKTQPNWSIASESETSGNSKDHLQGGALLYNSSDLTPSANSDYRLLNRTPTNQLGYPSYTIDSSLGGYEFLLANDVDNSNPVVQAEQLNWMYYLLNFGSIVNHDANGNFDSIRVDAVDNVDADLLQIAASYFKDAYKVNKNDKNANQHISILEDWSDNDAQYVKDQGADQATMDNKFRLSLKYALTMPYTDANENRRSGLEPLISNSLVNRASDETENEAIPNYSFVRAHDSEVQTVIAEIIKQRIDPSSDGLTFTMDQLRQAFTIYNADQLKTNKEFTQYNIPSTYALLLTNKDTIPRVYYGDMYTDDGQYMAKKSPYYSAIETLLRARKKYVAGGQNMKISYVTGAPEMAANTYHGVLTSVRYGKGALTSNDKGDAETRTQGIAVIESNEPNLRLSASDRIVINMGKAHANQAYRPLVLTTAAGLSTYQTDAAAPVSYIRYTNGEGQLIFDSAEIVGQSNPQVSGFLAAWVPVGASDEQDARTPSSTSATVDGKTLHSNAALDSQVMYEGFSNFQAFPTTADEYANVKIAQNAAQFKEWGVTYFELPPQYRSSTDNTFLDSIIQNGYAFTDRYDLGFETPTKYGTADQLIAAIKALHMQDMKVIADWVPDQIYNLPGDEVVTASRVNNFGEQNKDSVINKTLYVAKTVGGGKYQARYGGAFLKRIKKRYPDLFTFKQLSTGVPIDGSKRITQWSAKYFNGSNIQGRGAFYVLKDSGSNKYFKINGKDTFLPKQLLNLPAKTGFASDGIGMTYYSTSGYQAKKTFIEDVKSNWYYFDENGHMQYGLQNIDGSFYYFLPNGVELQNAFFEDEKNNMYYFGTQGKAYVNDYFMNADEKWQYFDQNGIMARGLVKVNFKGRTATQFFDDDGYQLKGQAIRDQAGNLRYFASDSGDMETDTFAEVAPNMWVYLGAGGIAVTGAQTIKGQQLYFDDDGYQIKGQSVKDQAGNLHYYDADSGEMITNRFERIADNTWIYLDTTGSAVTGAQTINGQQLYFDVNGIQVKGQSVKDQAGNLRYYDADSGEMITNRFERIADNTWIYLDTTGSTVTGVQTINGQQLYFDDNGFQVKGQVVRDGNGILHYYDADSGEMLTNRFVQLSSGNWIYIDNAGSVVTDLQMLKEQTIVDSNSKSKKYYNGENDRFVESI
ncbi:dextransucrase [Liquorilactobacillus sucicola DSM 21376 = JCM 15457]|uniref:dextransucrase n=2 Tax=Liquorilactobacillus sucicola TaxID=519050 RepID=A0A0R2DQ27_9LACO|nr:dextransucrase [Liquorilactobacillus sucicola DSM 21376 = JCM 15457]